MKLVSVDFISVILYSKKETRLEDEVDNGLSKYVER